METTYYEIRVENSSSYHGSKQGKYKFDTEEEAKQVAKEFKKNPKSHNENMSNENASYWQKQNYEIVKKTVVTQILTKI